MTCSESQKEKRVLTDQEMYNFTALRDTVWVHEKTNKLYVIKTIAMEESTERDVVVYFALGSAHSVFTRPLEEFMDGRFRRV